MTRKATYTPEAFPSKLECVPVTAFSRPEIYGFDAAEFAVTSARGAVTQNHLFRSTLLRAQNCRWRRYSSTRGSVIGARHCRRTRPVVPSTTPYIGSHHGIISAKRGQRGG